MLLLFSSRTQGLKEAFDARNGYARTYYYAIIWTASAIFFLFLTVPSVLAYQDKVVLTKFETDMDNRGLPLPAITVCPHGTGYRCDCTLWRRLHCRYSSLDRVDWMQRFDNFACWAYFDFSNDAEQPMWLDPQCDDFTNGSIAEITCRIDNLFDVVVARESRDEGPYVSFGELVDFAANDLSDQISFFRSNGPSNAIEVNKSYIKTDHIEQGRFQRCAKMEIPFDNDNAEQRQRIGGSEYGILLIVGGLNVSQYSLRDIYRATPSVAVHVGVSSDSSIPSAENFLQFGAGQHYRHEYRVQRAVRYRGWGDRFSKTCSEKIGSRTACIQATIYTAAAKACGCNNATSTNILHLSECSATYGSPQANCIESYIDSATLVGEAIPTSVCPSPCKTTYPVSTQLSSIALSAPQLLYVNRLVYPSNLRIGSESSKFGIENVTLISVGAASLLVQTLEESPVTSLASLFGLIGGNSGLWCGLSFSMLAENFEFLVIAARYGRPSWWRTWGRRH